MDERFIHALMIGIDTGTKTGFAVYDVRERSLVDLRTIPIHHAMELVLQYHRENGSGIMVRVEDARLRKWVPRTSGRERLQGAGSVKRDAAIWEAFLKDHRIPFQMVAPKNNRTKLSAIAFRSVTRWTARCSSHARDAAMLVFGF